MMPAVLGGRRAVWGLWLGFVALPLLALGCAKDGEDVTPTDQPAVLQFAISLPKQRFVAGETIRLTMTLRNVSSQTLTVNSRLVVNRPDALPSDRDVTVLITKPSGTEARFLPVVNVLPPGDESFQRLGPGMATEKTVNLFDRYELDETGQYRVEAIYENSLLGPRSFDEESGTSQDIDIGAVKARIGSNTLAFELVEPLH